MLDVPAAARYLGGISPWTVRGYIAEGLLPAVRLPGSAGALRRVLLDRRDLDRLVDGARTPA